MRFSDIRPFFLARTRREKFLAVLLLIALAVIWLSTFSGRAAAAWRDGKAVNGDVAVQSQWLDNAASIEARFDEALARLEGKTLPSKNEVLALIQALVQKHGFGQGFSLPPPVSQQRERLTFHTYDLSIQRASYDQLQAFHEDLASALRTVTLERFVLQADTRNPKQINASLRLVAIEFNR
jgi:Tfp pilus assembly protein PilO